MHSASEVLNEFMKHGDFSLEATRDLETELERFPDNDIIKDLLDILASYRPGGGEYLYDQVRLKKEIHSALNRLSS